MIKILYNKKLLFVCLYFIQTTLALTPQVYNANIGETVRLQCTTGGGQYVCFSTYTFQNAPHSMVMLNNSLKYQVTSGAVTINNVQATDAGFYACSSNCDQMRSDQISYFLQPMSMSQPIDTSKNFVPIPPFPNSANSLSGNQMYVVVTDERLDAALHGKVLSDGEIAGLVVGLFLAFVITVAVVVFLIIMNKKRKARGEKLPEPGRRNDKDSTIDYSTIDRDYDASANNTLTKDRDSERRSLSNNKSETSNLGNIVAEINTRNMKGPSSYRPSNDMNLIDPQDLPSIDIGYNNNKTNSQRSQQALQNNSTRSYNNNNNPSSRSYQNQLDIPYEDAGSNKNSMRDNTGMLQPPPANNRNQNKVNFPQRNPPQPQKVEPQQRYVSNENIHLQQIIKESGFIADVLDGRFDSEEDFSRREQPGKTGYYNTRNMDNYPYDQQFEPVETENRPPKNSNRPPKQPPQSSGIDLDLDLDTNDGSQTNNGGVTVVSARTPVRGGTDQLNNVLPPLNRSYQPQPTKYSFQQQPVQNPNKPSQLSLSQRIETTSTPLQLVPPSASMRGVSGQTSVNKDGATDV